MIKIYIGRETFPIGQKFVTQFDYQCIGFCGIGHTLLFTETTKGRVLKFHKGEMVDFK